MTARLSASFRLCALIGVEHHEPEVDLVGDVGRLDEHVHGRAHARLHLLLKPLLELVVEVELRIEAVHPILHLATEVRSRSNQKRSLPE